MKATSCMQAVIMVVASAPLWGQSAQPQTPATSSNEDAVIRVTTSLVQIEAMVTGKDGKPVRNLEQADFQILQDGKPRELTAFASVQIAPTSTDRKQPPTKTRPAATALPTPNISDGVQRDQVRRTIAIVVNNLTMGSSQEYDVRESLLKFIREQLTETDLAAIVATRGNMGIYSQFTNNRELLEAAAGRLTPTPFSDLLAGGASGSARGASEIQALQKVGVGSIIDAIRALRGMPGRKSLLLFSTGFPVVMIGSLLDQVADEATRAGVTIYAAHIRDHAALNARQSGPGVDMGADPRGGPPPRREPPPDPRTELSAGSLRDLAERTGGLFFENDNRLAELMTEALDDQSSYYLLGYNPGSESFDRTFHKIEVKVLKPGLVVRSHTGYVGQEGKYRP